MISGVDAHARRPITVHNKPPKDETNIVKERPPQKTTVKECASFCYQYTAQLSTDLPHEQLTRRQSATLFFCILWDTFTLKVPRWLYDYFSLGVFIIH